MAKKQYLDSTGLSTFWGKIKGYVDVPKISVAANDKFLSLDNKLVGATVTLRYDQATKQIGLYGKDATKPVSTIDATDFVKDGILKSVELTADNKLVFTWNTDAGKSPTTIELGKFLDNVNFDGANLRLADLPAVTDYTAPQNGDSLDTAIANLAAGVATHEGQIALINKGKTSWASGRTITSETYYNILKGTQDSFTLPFDLNGFVSSITANGNAQRYSGVMFAVSYANTPGQPKQRSNTLYLPFAAVNAEKGVVAFEDLQFHYTDLTGIDVDVRYKVTPAPGSQIKLEKVGAAELPWLDLSPADDEELKNFMNAFALAGQTGKAQEYALTAHEAVDITKYRGIVIDIASEGIQLKTPFVVSDGTYRICAETFIANSECVLACKCADSKLWLTLINISLRDMFQYQSTFAKTSDLSDYAKKIDVYTKAEVDAKLTGMVKIQKLTQEEYDALVTKDENVLYAIIEPGN